MFILGVVAAAVAMALLSGPLRMLLAVRRADLTSRGAFQDLVAVAKYGGVDVECSDFNQRARLVAVRRYRSAHPTASDADVAIWLSEMFGQNNPALQSEAVFTGRVSKRRLMLTHAWRITQFAVRY